jgi:Putative peptidoglycan binding domain
VRWAQACLAQLLGPGVPQDGILGVLTQNAIHHFQAEQQMPVTGMLDGDTIAAIRAACGEHEAVADGGGIELHDVEEPYPPQPWPPSRRFHPPPLQTIPSGRYRTFSPCDAVLNDFDRLAAAVDGLKAALREWPANLAWLQNRADAVTAISREIVTRLSARHYVELGCGREDLATLASSVNVLRGSGGDADAGSWPLARSAREQGPRSQARQSLRHLLAWCRRAARRFPRI